MNDFKISFGSSNNKTLATRTKDGVITIYWNDSSVEMKNIEEAKTVALILFKIIMDNPE